jgi:hypothetical protein
MPQLGAACDQTIILSYLNDQVVLTMNGASLVIAGSVAPLWIAAE